MNGEGLRCLLPPEFWPILDKMFSLQSISPFERQNQKTDPWIVGKKNRGEAVQFMIPTSINIVFSPLDYVVILTLEVDENSFLKTVLKIFSKEWRLKGWKVEKVCFKVWEEFNFHGWSWLLRGPIILHYCLKLRVPECISFKLWHKLHFEPAL